MIKNKISILIVVDEIDIFDMVSSILDDEVYKTFRTVQINKKILDNNSLEEDEISALLANSLSFEIELDSKNRRMFNLHNTPYTINNALLKARNNKHKRSHYNDNQISLLRDLKEQG